jgi:small subunit ribosomal protein S9
MASNNPGQLFRPLQSICRQCRRRTSRLLPIAPIRQPRKPFSTTTSLNDELQAYVEAESAARDSYNITAAPPFELDSRPVSANVPARILPASPSYFTASPQFNDNVLLLRSLLREYETLPTVPSDQAPKATWLKLAAYRSRLGEPVTSGKYSKVLQLLSRLNRIHPKLQTTKLRKVLEMFRRPDAVSLQKPPPPTLDEEGRASGVGRRKESSAKVYLVEGTGEVMVNGRNIVQAFPRLHDRESALWALKITGRMDKYNVFALTHGGGLTGQAESITLGLARALMVHEPALKPTLRKGKHI